MRHTGFGWPNITNNHVKSLVKYMLDVNFESRFTASECLDFILKTSIVVPCPVCDIDDHDMYKILHPMYEEKGMYLI